MAFGNFLKKVADKGMAMVNDAVEKGKQIAEEQKTVEKQKALEAAEVQRIENEKELEAARAVKAQEKQDEYNKVMNPTCDKGDCLWYKEKFYFTCPRECECERKQYTKKDWGCEITHPEFWRYMKQRENKKYFISNEESIYKEFMGEFLPQYGKENWGIARNFVSNGLTEDTLFFPIYLAIKDEPALKTSIGQQIDYCCGGLSEEWKTIYKEPFCRNISLYSRSLEDFEYTVKVLAMVLDEEKLSQFFQDTSNINVEQLLDSDGNVKPAGIGGPQKGHYGDTIWNTIESWSD